MFPLFLSISSIFNNPRGSWALGFIYFTVINCKIPLCSFNNTFNRRPPPTYPLPDLTPEWTPNHPDPDFFQFYYIFNLWFTSTRPPAKSLPRLFNFTIASILGSHPPDPPFFQFHNKFNSWFTSTRPTPARPHHPDYPDFFSFTIL